jgi:uncharacterized protein (DUF58 family)
MTAVFNILRGSGYFEKVSINYSLPPENAVINHWTNWLEQKWVAPAYAGWVLMAVSLCFFGAATNTMTGWLYVLSAVGIVLLILAAVLPIKSLQALSIEHLPIAPITQGEDLQIALRLHNRSKQTQRLLQVFDRTPTSWGEVQPLAIEQVPAQGSYTTTMTCTPPQRGIYNWDALELRSGQPLGLFWCRRERKSPAQVYVYPAHLRLSHCPLLDHWQQSVPATIETSVNRPQLSTIGTTRSLRPYRSGDPLRLIHWRSSARYERFQVRELEIANYAHTITICLNASSNWSTADFEQAVIATCSLYYYARQHQLDVQLWTSSHGVLTSQLAVMQALAAIQISTAIVAPPPGAVLWISNQLEAKLAEGSRALLWTAASGLENNLGVSVHANQSLVTQLQKSLNTAR